MLITLTTLTNPAKCLRINAKMGTPYPDHQMTTLTKMVAT